MNPKLTTPTIQRLSHPSTTTPAAARVGDRAKLAKENQEEEKAKAKVKEKVKVDITRTTSTRPLTMCPSSMINISTTPFLKMTTVS